MVVQWASYYWHFA